MVLASFLQTHPPSYPTTRPRSPTTATTLTTTDQDTNPTTTAVTAITPKTTTRTRTTKERKTFWKQALVAAAVAFVWNRVTEQVQRHWSNRPRARCLHPISSTNLLRTTRSLLVLDPRLIRSVPNSCTIPSCRTCLSLSLSLYYHLSSTATNNRQRTNP